MAQSRLSVGVTQVAGSQVLDVAAGGVIFTIVSRNYIAQAATLMQSVRAVHPGCRRVIVLADELWDFGALDLAAELIPVSALGAPEIGNMKLWYDVLEFNTAVKPYAFLHLFRMGFGRAVYLDPDILVSRPLTEVFTGLTRHSLVLTPHITQPLPREGYPTDHSIMKSGVWNCGFIALRNDSDGQRVARWWAERLLAHCRSDVSNNLFTDQRWIDLAPCFVAKVLRLRHPGYNVAYWNLPHRALRQTRSGGWRVAGKPVVFFHFSGFAIDKPATLSRYDTRHDGHDSAPLAALCRTYVCQVRANGWEQFKDTPYAFASFADGRPVERTMRRWLLRAIDGGRLNPTRRLALGSDYFDQADEEAAAKGIGLTRLSYQLWLDRIDLQSAFDLAKPDRVKEYRLWFASGEALRQGVAPESIAAQEDISAEPTEFDAIGRVTRRVAPPWPPVAEENCWLPASAAARFVTGRVVARIADSEVTLDRQAALTWERRDDINHGFPLRAARDARAYVAWAMTRGITEGAVDPALLDASFIAELSAPTALGALYGDVPINLLMQMTKDTPSGRGALKDHDRFPAERRGRLSHALWFAFVAPALYGWPEALFAAVRDWLRTPAMTCGEYEVSQALLAVWELRDDVQADFPLHSAASQRAFLRWVAFHGLPDFGLTAAAVDPALLDFLTGPAELIAGVSEQVAGAHALRTDLKNSYDVTTPAGLRALRKWGEAYFASEYHAVLGVADSAPRATRRTIHKTLALTGQWSVPSGRGEDVRGTALALREVGFTDFVVIDRDRNRVMDAGGAIIENAGDVVVDINLVHMNANTAYEDWRFSQRLDVRAGRTIGWWAWELERLPDYWRHAFAFSDEIWASTKFARDAFASQGARRVTLVPMAVSVPTPAASSTRAELGISDDERVFFFAFDYRSYIARKNPEAVIAAFLEAFPMPAARARLLIKTQGAAQAPAAARRLRALAEDRRITLWDCTLDRAAMLAAVASCDVYVSLHRSEGFGRGPAEAMLLGKPVILTDYSGTQDFADASCALPIACRQVAVRPGEYPGGEDQHWAEPSVSDAARAMRWVIQHPKAARALGQRARQRIDALYAPSRSGAAILNALGLAEPARWRDQLAKAAAD